MDGVAQPVGTAQGVIVVGAGIGGLTAAVTLAGAGVPVTLIEADAVTGGKLRAVPSDAGPVDCGPTVLTKRHVFDALFSRLGLRLDDHVTLHRADTVARHWWPDGAALDLTSDAGANETAVRAALGSRAALDYARFEAETQAMHDAFAAPVMHAPRPSAAGILAATLRRPALIPALLKPNLAAYLNARFCDPRLRQLFGRYATYVGGAPNASPAVLALIWQAERAGVWTVEGGLSALAAALTQVAERLGATVLTGAPVAEVLRNGPRAAGVRLASGLELRAPHVVFAGDPAALLPKGDVTGAARAIRRNATHPRSLSANVWSFAAAVEGPVLAHHTVLFADSPNSEFEDIARGRLPRDPSFYICAQDRPVDPATGPAPLERFEIIANAASTDVHTQTPQETAQCHRKMLTRLASFGLTLSPEPTVADLATPHRFAARYPGSHGAIYGRSPHGVTASFRRPTAETRVPGLWLAGGGTHPGAGVPMAALSGMHAAEAILRVQTSTLRSRRTAMPGGTSTA